MKLKHQLAILTASLLLGACSAENLLDTQAPPEVEENDPMRREVLLTFKNLLNLKSVETRAGDPIATEAENYIETLDVYVFGSKDEAGPYTFQELHYYRDDAAEVTLPGVESHSFGLRAGADDATTNGLLKLKKGLYVKLYCVANRTTLYQTDDAGIVTAFSGLKSLVQDKPGQDDNTVDVGVPTEEAFKKFHTKLIDPTVADAATADDVLAPSLPMTGAYTTPLDLTDFGTSARTQISFKLTRMVARFDLVNDAAVSKFTIEHIALGNGQSAARFFPIETMVADPAKLIAYPKREVAAITQQTATSLTKGAFYTWPSPKDDKGYLILSGSYAVNATEKIKVSYKVPFQQMVNNVGTYIEVAHNHRYTIGITKATDYHLDFTLQVADWEDTEEMDRYEPDNSFDGQTLTLDVASSTGAYVQSNGLISLLPTRNSGFGFEMGSNTALVDEILFTPGSEEWIKKLAVTPVTRAGSMEMLYTYAVDDTKLTDPTKLLPVTIRLTNPASGMRKEIKIIPTKGPEVSLVEGGSAFSKFDAATMTATMYNVGDQEIVLRVLSETRPGTAEAPTEVTGSTVAAADNWIICTGDGSTASTDYKFTLDAHQTTSSPVTTLTFTSTATTATTKINVVLKSAEMTALTAADIKVDATGLVEFTGGTGGIPKVTLAGAAGSSMTINITSPEGVTAIATGGSDWLDVNANGNVITARIKEGVTLDAPKSDGKITITNVLDPTEIITIEVATTVVVVEPETPEAPEPEVP